MVWILPTLNRPAQCVAVLDKIRETGCVTKGVIVLNGFDGWSMAGAMANMPDGWEVYQASKNIGALGALNLMLKEYPNEEFYGFIGDDEFVQSEGWDGALIEAAGDWNISHGDDGVNGDKRFQGFVCVGGKLARAVGYLAIPECWHWYGLDDMWETLARAKACQKKFLPTVKIEHKHPLHGKGAMDECYELGLSRKDIDQQVYFHWVRHKLPGVVDKIKKARDLV